jgi:hypothetical protein
MSLCVVAVLVLGIAEVHPTADRLIATLALVLFGAGLGVFIAPNNNATLKAAPRALSGEAGSLLNLMRVLGTSVGVASAASTLSWRLHASNDPNANWADFAGHPMLAAVESSLIMVAVMAIAAGIISVIQSRGRTSPR